MHRVRSSCFVLAAWACSSVGAHAADAPVGQPETPSVAPDAAPAAAEAAPEALVPSWSLRLPPGNTVEFKCQLDFDRARGANATQGQPLYPGDNAASFLGAVLAHGMMASAAKKAEKARVEQAAAEILSPYVPTLSAFDPRQLMRSGVAAVTGHGTGALIEPLGEAAGDWRIDSAPTYWLTQDQSAVILDNLVRVRGADPAAGIVFENVIRVVAQPRSGTDDFVAYWTADEGRALKDQSAALLAISLDIALDAVKTGAAAQAGPQKTFRYKEGTVDKIERAQLLDQSCDRALIKNLRGWLVSIPLSPGPALAAAPCGADAAAPAGAP